MAAPEATDTTTVYTLDQIREVVVPYARSAGMRWARVFGSYARGEATGESDIDVLVDLGDARALSLFGLMEHIWETTGKRPAFMGVENCRFRAPVIPPAEIVLKAKLVMARHGIFKYSGELYTVDAEGKETLCTKADFSAAMV